MREDPVLAAPVESLQLMLRTLSFYDSELPLLIPDGIYGDATASAVSAFQQKYGLPVTGIADSETHGAIVSAYDLVYDAQAPSPPPILYFPADLVILPGQSHPHVFLVQGMLAALGMQLPELQEISLTGRIDSPTESNLRRLQALSQREVSGNLDQSTYHDLVRLYRGFYDRSGAPSNG